MGSSGLTDLLDTFLDTIRSAQVPSGPARRRGGDSLVGEVLARVPAAIEFVRAQFVGGNLGAIDAANYVAESAMELTSVLFVGGAPHPTWRRWAGLAAVGSWHAGAIQQAAQYAALGNEWALIRALPELPALRGALEDLVLWRVLGGVPQPALPATATGPLDHAWLSLATSIPAGDHATTASALDDIAEAWMLETDDDWEDAHRGAYPDYFLPGCVAAAAARHRGLPHALVRGDTYRFLEAGLADGAPDALYPDTCPRPG